MKGLRIVKFRSGTRAEVLWGQRFIRELLDAFERLPSRGSKESSIPQSKVGFPSYVFLGSCLGPHS